MHVSIKSSLAWRSRHKKIRDRLRSRLRSRLRLRLNQRIKNINSLLNMRFQCQDKYQHVVVLTTGVKYTTLEQENYAPQMPIYLIWTLINPSHAELTQATRALCLYHIPTEIYNGQLLTEVEPVNSSPYSYNNDILFYNTFWFLLETVS